MKKQLLLPALLLLCLSSGLFAQVLYVDAVKGNDTGKGTLPDPLASLAKAASLAAEFTGSGPVTIKLAPGLYKLPVQLKIEPRKGQADTSKYSLEAMIMPDDSNWEPGKMPVIQSVSPNNTYQKFDHCAGIEIFRNNVRIKGLKFVGNANPEAEYYYAIERDSSGLKELEISQCYFIGDKNWAPIQGAVYTQGADIHVDHCVFFGCKHDLLLFESIRGFSLTHSILYGSYGAAVWFGTAGDPDEPFLFGDNIIAHCNYFWACATAAPHPRCKFSHSLISGNQHFMGIRINDNLTPFDGNDGHLESDIQKSGEVSLNEVTIKGMPRNFLQLAPSSAGKDIDAGIFIKE